LNSLHSLL